MGDCSLEGSKKLMEYGLFLLFAGLIIPVLLGSALRLHSVGVLLAILFLQGLKIVDTLFSLHVQRFLYSFYAMLSESQKVPFLAHISSRILIVLLSLLPFAVGAGVLFWLAFTKLDDYESLKLKHWTTVSRPGQHIIGGVAMSIVGYTVYFWGKHALISFNLVCVLLFAVLLFPEIRNVLTKPPIVQKDLREANHLLQESIQHRRYHGHD